MRALPDLVEQAGRTYPGIGLLPLDILEVAPATIVADGGPAAFDLVVAVGNVFILLAEGTERRALESLRSVLAPRGRILVGFHLVGGPAGSRAYPPEEFALDVEAAGRARELGLGFARIEMPNDAPDLVDVLAGIVRRELAVVTA